jgi:hypothetical protein
MAQRVLTIAYTDPFRANTCCQNPFTIQLAWPALPSCGASAYPGGQKLLLDAAIHALFS